MDLMLTHTELMSQVKSIIRVKGFLVFNYGFESILRNYKAQRFLYENYQDDKLVEYLRFFADLLVVGPRRAFLLEVKSASPDNADSNNTAIELKARDIYRKCASFGIPLYIVNHRLKVFSIDDLDFFRIIRNPETKHGSNMDFGITDMVHTSMVDLESFLEAEKGGEELDITSFLR